uniref:N-acetyltransferase domain-containing protein n=1 Tax=Glossina morsitans morsitans TaxID=37546 RepID=A0A1B0FGS2_GLOMM
MSERCLKLICNGEFEIVKITEDLYDAAVEDFVILFFVSLVFFFFFPLTFLFKLFQNYFSKNENLGIALNLIGCQDTRASQEKFLRLLLKDNISFAARHIPSQQLAALCVNKIEVNKIENSSHTTEAEPNVGIPKMEKIGEIIHHMTTSFDVYKEWQGNCIIELTFLSTRTEFCRRGLALHLTDFILDYGRKLKEQDSKEALDLPAHVKGQRSEALTSVFTSRFSQRIGEKLGFVTLFREEYTKFSFEGETLAEKIDPQHKYIIFVAKRL